MNSRAALLTLLLGSCAADPLTVTPTAAPGQVSLATSAPVEAVEVLDAAGAPVLRRTLPSPAVTVTLPLDLAPGAYTVRVRGDGQTAEAPVAVEATAPVRVEVIPVAGQPWQAAEGEIAVPVAGETAEVVIGVVGGPGAPPEVAWSGGDPLALPAPGQRVTRTVTIAPGERRAVTVGEASFTLVGTPVDKERARAAVTLSTLTFPTDVSGAPELGRPAWRVTLAAGWWQELTRGLGLGVRAADAWSPWAGAGATFTNTGEEPADLSITLTVTQDGAPAPAFRPRLREGDASTGHVSALLRVPAHGSATAVLPVFVDPALATAGAYTLTVDAAPIGAADAWWSSSETLYVREGDTAAGLGFLGTLLASAGGWAWVGLRLRRWLTRAATSELMTIALFGAILFVVGSASDVISMGVGALLGPFSTLLTGILQDATRVALLGTLVTLLPRPGVLALATLTGWLGRALTTGGFSPTDLLYTGVTVALAEGFAWLAGLTRGGDWRDGSAWARWMRMSAAFGPANLLTTLAGLWMHVVLFRLYFADWYLALQALGPGFLYVLAACALAVPFAASLRKVEA